MARPEKDDALRGDGAVAELSFDDIKSALDKMNPLSKFLTWTDQLAQIKSTVAGVAMLVERFLKADTLYFLKTFADDTFKAFSGMLSARNTVHKVVSEGIEALQDDIVGREAVERIEAFAARVDAKAQALAQELPATARLRAAAQVYAAGLSAERDARLPQALERSGIAAVHDLGTHLAVIGDHLGRFDIADAESLAVEAALVSGLRDRLAITAPGVAGAVSISTGGDVSAFLGLSGSVSVSFSLYLANVDARLHLYQMVLQATQARMALG